MRQELVAKHSIAVGCARHIRQRGAIVLLPVLIIAAILTSILATIYTRHELSIGTVLNAQLYDEVVLAGMAIEQLSQQMLNRDRAQNRADHYNEAWARPISGLNIEGVNVNACLLDEQSRLNLNNFSFYGSGADQPSLSEFALGDVILGLARMFDAPLELSTIAILKDWMDDDNEVQAEGGAEDDVYTRMQRPYRTANQKFSDVSELALLNRMSITTVQSLYPFLSALPVRTKINVNTASQQLLRALVKDENDITVRGLTQKRPFQTRKDLIDYLRTIQIGTENGSEEAAEYYELLDVKSDYFLLIASIKVEGLHVMYRSHLARSSAQTAPWSRTISVVPQIADELLRVKEDVPDECLAVHGGESA